MKKTWELPYLNSQKLDKEFKKECKKWDGYLKNVFVPFFKKECENSKFVKVTRWVHTNPKDFIYWIRDLKQTARMARHPFYMYLDIEKFYPNIDHKILIEKVENLYLRKRSAEKLKNWRFNKKPKFSRDFKKFLKFLEIYLWKSDFKSKWILSWTSIWFFLAEIYLYEFFINLNFHVFKWNDDIVILSRFKKDLTSEFPKISQQISELKLNFNISKLKSWKLFQDKFSYLWFEFKKWKIIWVEPERVKILLQKVKNIFNLKWKKSEKMDILKLEKLKLQNKKLSKRIKKLRKLQFWFFNYYRLSIIKFFWFNLSAKIRKIVRNWLFKFKSSFNSKFIIESKYLKNIWVVEFNL